jgi:hypothetical protein
MRGTTQGGDRFHDREPLRPGRAGRRAAREMRAKSRQLARERGLAAHGADFRGGLQTYAVPGDLDAAGIGVRQHRHAVAAVQAHLAAFFPEAIRDFKNRPRGRAQNSHQPHAATVERFGVGKTRRRNFPEDEWRQRHVVRGEVPRAVHIAARARPVGPRAAQAMHRPQLA